MTTALRALAGLVAALAVSVVALRWRKLRRDERRLLDRPVDRRLLAPPPSPYRPSQGFKLLDGAEPLAQRPTPERPRLDPDHDYVFSDSPGEDRAGAPGRHDSRWALERATRRSGVSGGVRALLVVLVAAALIGGVGYALHRARHPGRGPTATTTAPPGATTTTNWPAAFAPVGGPSGTDYSVPAASYELTVTGERGAVGTLVRVGAAHAVAYQGTVARGAAKSLVVTGVARVTLDLPGNATLTIGASPVTLPSPLTSPVTLTFTPRG